LWIETASGSIDASPAAQWNEIERGLADRLAAVRPADGP
jgi:flagellar biosynthesis/type III secretory pathway protein FliH